MHPIQIQIATDLSVVYLYIAAAGFLLITPQVLFQRYKARAAKRGAIRN